MMIFKLMISTGLLLYTTFSNIYQYSVPLIQGGNLSLSAYTGKKIMMVVLPLEQNASSDSMLFSLDTLAAAHYNNLQVIAVPAYEDGYSNSQKENLRQWYRSKLDNRIIITDGLYTRKTSGNQQHDLYKWLTQVGMNNHFDLDTEGPGQSYFVNTQGELYAVLRPQTKMWSRTITKVILLENEQSQ